MAKLERVDGWYDSDTMRVFVHIGESLHEFSLDGNELITETRDMKDEEKKSLVSEYQNSNRTLVSFSKEAGIGIATLHRWIKKYGSSGDKTPPKNNEPKGEIPHKVFDDIQKMRAEGRTSQKISEVLGIPLVKVNAAMVYVDYQDYAAFNPVKSKQ